MRGVQPSQSVQHSAVAGETGRHPVWLHSGLVTPTGSAPTPALRRVIGTGGAVAIGLAAMVGAGVFTVWGPAAASAGSLLLVGLAVAAVVATANALSSAQLAVRYPEAGGTYVYGRRRLGEWWGFLAGWSFVVGKTASCAAMALAIASAVVPPVWQRPVGVAVALALGLLASGGVVRTVRASLVAVVFVAAVLVALMVTAMLILVPVAPLVADGGSGVVGSSEPTLLGVLQAAGLLFFAFAGYARMATLGEEVRDPRRTLVRAIPLALGIALALYLTLAWVLLTRVGPTALAGSTAPVVDLARAVGSPLLNVLVTVAAVVAAAGAMLALFAGIGRTALGMAREGDLPRPLARVSGRSGAPAAAQLTVAVLVAAIVLVADLRGAIGFSSFGVLLYYFVANLAAVGQPREERLFPRIIPCVGMAGTLLLAVLLPLPSVVGGLAVVGIGVLIRLVARLFVRSRRIVQDG